MSSITNALFTEAVNALLPIILALAAAVGARAMNTLHLMWTEKVRTSKSAALLDAARRQVMIRLDNEPGRAFTEKEVQEGLEYLLRTYATSIRQIGATEEGVRGLLITAAAEAGMAPPKTPPSTFVPG